MRQADSGVEPARFSRILYVIGLERGVLCLYICRSKRRFLKPYQGFKETAVMADTAGDVGLNHRDAKHYQALVDLRDHLSQQIRSLSSSSLVSAKQAGEELADIGSDDFIRETELILMGEEGKRLQLIEAALKRIEDGTYGRCMDCGADIPEARLEAKPYAACCVDCKSTREVQRGLPASGTTRRSRR